MRNERDPRKKEGDTAATSITVNDVWDFIDKIRDQEKRWSFFEVETFVTEARGKFFFEIEVKTKQEKVCGSPIGIRIAGFERSPITSVAVNLDHGSESEELVSTTFKDFSETIERIANRAKQLEEFIQICNFIKSFVKYPKQ